MSFSVLEQLRSSHEDIENIEKAMSMVLMDKHKNSKVAVSCEHALKYLVEATQLKCKTAIDIYQDKDGMRTDDINALAGQRADKKGGDVWTSFYDKVKEVKDYHRRFSVNQGLPEVQNSEWFYQRALENDKTESLFSGEEDYGKRVDMQELFVTYLNLKKISTQRRNNFRAATYARLKKKTVDLEPDDPEVDKTVEKEYHELDYIEWLKTFDQFHEISRYCKYGEKNYSEYLEGLISYLRGFLLRTQPLIDVTKLEQQFEKEFEERWGDKSIPGWQDATHKDKLFCMPTNKLFNKDVLKTHHEGGKQYKRKLADMQKLSVEDQNQYVAKVEEQDKGIARLESRAAKWHDLLSDAINETIQHLQKKQSQTIEEMELEKDESDEDEDMEDDGADVASNAGDDEERPIYNPLNLPLGWDGKPIPFWLYKLHGMGIEYKCEICGNYSYWGRRAFERHFQEWRHAFGMRCLKIPNTAHFKEITKIEEAITLYEKLKRDAEEQTFRPEQDVECEDIQGNVMSQRAFEDLRRQGLV
ncbi:ATO [Symbiodinium sp. CCMP2592]|nr:ATO [Symbiodinium sp. CCMP2592]